MIAKPVGVRLKEHQKDTETVVNLNFTKENRKDSSSEVHKSAITNHIAQHCRLEVRGFLTETQIHSPHEIRGAIHIRKKGPTSINRDEGAFHLDHMHNPLLRKTITSLPGNNVNKQWTRPHVIKPPAQDCES